MNGQDNNLERERAQAISQPWEKGTLDKNIDWSLKFGGPGSKYRRSAAGIIKQATEMRLTEEIEGESELLQYGNMRGDPKYRAELAKFLTKQYGAPVDRDDLICTAGATQGLYTLSSLLFQAGDVVFVEDPTYFMAQVVFKKDNLFQLVPVPTEDKGIDVDALDRLMTEYKDKGKTQITETTPYRSLIYLIPTFNNPTSRCMAPERCQRVVELARKHDSLIVCDDVYNTVSWIPKSDGSIGNPPLRLFAYDKKTDPDYKGHVVSNGSFSKFMGPGLRLGWWEAPARVHAAVRKSGCLGSGGGFNQYLGGIMGKALEMGLVEKHTNILREEFRDKVSAVCQVLREKMPDGVKFDEPQGGYFIWVELPDSIDVPKLQQTCLDTYKLSFLPGYLCSPEGNYKNCIRLSFSYYTKEELIKAVIILAEATTKMLQK